MSSVGGPVDKTEKIRYLTFLFLSFNLKWKLKLGLFLSSDLEMIVKEKKKSEEVRGSKKKKKKKKNVRIHLRWEKQIQNLKRLLSCRKIFILFVVCFQYFLFAFGWRIVLHQFYPWLKKGSAISFTDRYLILSIFVKEIGYTPLSLPVYAEYWYIYICKTYC